MPITPTVHGPGNQLVLQPVSDSREQPREHQELRADAAMAGVRMRRWLAAAALMIVALDSAGLPSASAQSSGRSSRYDELVSLFGEWRAFQLPKLVNGVLDTIAKQASPPIGGDRPL